MVATDWYAPSVLFQVSAIPDNDRGPRYAEAVLSSLHVIDRQRQIVCLELGSHQSTVGLFVRVPAGLVAMFTHDFADAYPGCTLAALSDEVRDNTGHVWSATLRLSPDVFPLKTHRQFEDLLHRELTDPLAGLLSALRARSKGCVDARIALAIRPCRASWYRSAGRVVARIERGFRWERLGYWYAKRARSGRWLVRCVARLVGRLARRAASSHDAADARDKLSKHLFETQLVLTVCRATSEEAAAREALSTMAGAFGRFTSHRVVFEMSPPRRGIPKRIGRGYVLKFYCPIRCQRIRKNCGTRDQREARRILRECRERLLNGEYLASQGAITSASEVKSPTTEVTLDTERQPASKSWQECYDRYREHLRSRVRQKSLTDSLSRLQIAKRILVGHRQDQQLSEQLTITECLTLDMLEYLQDRLLAGDESRFDFRAPSTVNSMLGVIMAFVRFCSRHRWIESVPALQKLKVEEVMKGRPITGEEFERMLEATPLIVGSESSPSWEFALRILCESGFRVGDLMDFSWDDERRIHPRWPVRAGHHATIAIPSSQKNGLVQEIPMLPGLDHLLNSVPRSDRTGWVVNPEPIQYEIQADSVWFRPTTAGLRDLTTKFSNRSIAAACGVSDTMVRKWLAEEGIRRKTEFHRSTGAIPTEVIDSVRRSSRESSSHAARRATVRMTKDRFSRIITMIGEKAGIVVRPADDRTGQRVKHASSHDLRRGCAQRLINAGITAETLKVVLRHRDFATTEKFYGATRSAQSAATELHTKLSLAARSGSFVGGLVGGKEEAPPLNAEELQTLKRLLASL